MLLATVSDTSALYPGLHLYFVAFIKGVGYRDEAYTVHGFFIIDDTSLTFGDRAVVIALYVP